MNKQVRTIVLTIVATLLVVLMLQNFRPVMLRVIVWETSAPLALLLPVVFVCGGLLGWFWRRR